MRIHRSLLSGMLALAVIGVSFGCVGRPADTAAPIVADTRDDTPAAVTTPEPEMPDDPAVDIEGPSIVIDGGHHRYKSGSADDQLGLRLELVFTAEMPGGEPLRLTIYLLRGPEGRHFAGRSFGTSVLVSGGSTTLDQLQPYQTLLTLEPFERNAGAVIRGTLTIDALLATPGGPVRVEGGAPFEVTYQGSEGSPDDHRLASPEAVANPFAVTFFGRDFRPSSAIANVVREPSGRDVLSDLVFYEAAGARCDAIPLGPAIDVELQSLTGAEAREGPQPTGSLYLRERRARRPHASEASWYPDGWFRLDRSPLTPGGRATGELVIHQALQYTGVEADPYVIAVSAAGKFDAIVCHRGAAADWEALRIALPD